MDQSASRPASAPTDRLVGEAPAIQALRAQIHRLAAFGTIGSALVPTVLLQGETGLGKGLVAQLIHASGPRAQGPFIEVNCAAIPEALLEAELFGFEPGSFPDAKRAKPGLFEAAARGTLFLDEIDALPLPLQGKLLSVIEGKSAWCWRRSRPGIRLPGSCRWGKRCRCGCGSWGMPPRVRSCWRPRWRRWWRGGSSCTSMRDQPGQEAPTVAAPTRSWA